MHIHVIILPWFQCMLYSSIYGLGWGLGTNKTNAKFQSSIYSSTQQYYFFSFYPPCTDLFDREFKQALQRVPRDLSSVLEARDHPPSGRALQCRRNFGPLQVI